MIPDINFESLLYNPFSIHESSINSEYDPGINFYQDIFSLETHYCSLIDFQNNFQFFLKDSLSVLHLNFTSMNKNFESFKECHSVINFKFSIVCFFRNMGRRHIFQQKFQFSTFRLPGPVSNKKKS